MITNEATLEQINEFFQNLSPEAKNVFMKTVLNTLTKTKIHGKATIKRCKFCKKLEMPNWCKCWESVDGY